MLDKEKKVQGVAVYAEFKKPGQAMAILLTPDGYTTLGSLVPMTFFRRVVTKDSPKKQWKPSSLRIAPLQEVIDNFGGVIQDGSKETFVEQRISRITSYFDLILTQGWVLEGKPILIEVSRHDMEDIAKGKTPNKIMYRVHISRKALGFPELVA